MFTIQKSFFFSAAHLLKLSYKSPCGNLHGHNWKVTITCQADELDENGMVIDFGTVKQMVMDKFDHKTIDAVALGGLNPTAENIAWFIFCMIPKSIKVEIEESEGNYACYE